MKTLLRSLSVRLDPKKIDIARGQGVKLGELFREALDQKILEQVKICPICKTKKK